MLPTKKCQTRKWISKDPVCLVWGALLIGCIAMHLLLFFDLFRYYPANQRSLYSALVSFLLHGFLLGSVLASMIWIADYLKKRVWYILSGGFVSLSLAYLFSDFMLYRLAGIHGDFFWRFYKKNTWGALLSLLRETGISLSLYGLIGVCALMVFGLGGYLGTYIRNSHHIAASPRTGKALLLLSILASLGLFLEQSWSRSYKDQEFWRQEQNTFPFCFRFYKPSGKDEKSSFTVKVRQDWDFGKENQAIVMARRMGKAIIHRPPLFFFILESVRQSFLTQEVAPHLSKFMSVHGLAKKNLSASNATSNSWYGILHGRYPFCFSAALHRPATQYRSLALQILREAGYSLHILSSADLSFFDSGEAAFGKKYHLVHEHVEQKGVAADIADQKTMDRLVEIIETEPLEGQAYFVFLDSPHHNYHWPSSFEAKFTPFPETINFLSLTVAPKIVFEGVKNRYRNSLAYIDSLFGRFQDAMREKNQFDGSIIAITGDHGEEFMEKGKFTHASHLVEEQITPPVGLKVPGKSFPSYALASQIDLLPSILDSLGVLADPEMFDGRSVFQKETFASSRLVSRNSNTEIPQEFVLQTDAKKIYFHLILEEGSDLGQVYINYITDWNDQREPIPEDPVTYEQEILQPFRSELSQLSLIKEIL